MPLTNQTRVLHRFVQVTAEHLFGSELPDGLPAFQITPTTDPRFGHFACNLAMQLAKPLKRNPRQIGEELALALKDALGDTVERIEVAGPGFLNLFLSTDALSGQVQTVLTEEKPFQWTVDEPLRINLEYVSANPTGPLLVVNGRAAAMGSALAEILKAVGHDVTQEYFVNDTGTQVVELGKSVLRDGNPLLRKKGWTFSKEVLELVKDAGYAQDTVGPLVEPVCISFDEKYERIVRQARGIEEGEELNKHFDSGQVFYIGIDSVEMQLELHKETLRRFGIKFNDYYREHQLYLPLEHLGNYEYVLREFVFTDDLKILNKPNCLLLNSLVNLRSKGATDDSEGALWLKTTDYGDEKDRVIVRSSGKPTYLLTDIAYHLDKWERLGGDESERLMVVIWGPDHYGHILPTKAGLLAAGLPEGALEVLTSGWVTLKRGGETVSMSKRKGNLATLDELLDEVGVDVARYMFLERSPEAHLDFDLDLAVQQSSENPAYYIQYAHARICSIFAKAEEEGYSEEELSDDGLGPVDLAPLFTDDDAGSRQRELLRQIVYYPGVIESAAKNHAPQKVAAYLHGLAGVFHPYYKKVKVLVEDKAKALARLALCRALQKLMDHGLGLLGITSPRSM
ncbi:arginine--tRNA ligase [bacterium]|nr:arginine--tRNA ligase [bacterium]